MEIPNDIVYQIEEKKEVGRTLVIKAGKKWTQDKIKKYEGIVLKIPIELKINKKTTFVVLGIKKKDHETYILHLHSHDFDLQDLKYPYDVPKGDEYAYIDGGGDVEVALKIKSDILSSWTNIYSTGLRIAFDTLNLGYSYNLLVSIPRTITVTTKQVILSFNPHKKVDPLNVCNYLLKNNHPIDN